MRLFLDMDGVLVDYYAGVCEAHGHKPWPYFCRVGDWNFYDGDPMHLNSQIVAPKMGRDFYATLPWMRDGKAILAAAEKAVGAENVFLLSSPWSTPGCDEGKRLWVRVNAPAYAPRTLIGACKEACAFRGGILFDDSDANCKLFVKWGGRARVVPRPWNSRHEQASLQCGSVSDRHLQDLFDLTGIQDPAMPKTPLSEAVVEINRAARSLYRTIDKAAGKDKQTITSEERAEYMAQAQQLAFNLWKETEKYYPYSKDKDTTGLKEDGQAELSQPASEPTPTTDQATGSAA